MRISEISEYVVPGVDVESGDIIIFENAGKVVEIQGEDGVRKRVQFLVRLPDGKTKYLTLNKTSLFQLQKDWGDDTSLWVGKQAQVTIIEQNVRGTLKKIIYLKGM